MQVAEIKLFIEVYLVFGDGIFGDHIICLGSIYGHSKVYIIPVGLLYAGFRS